MATLVEIASGRVSHVDLDLRPHEVAVSPDGRIAALTIPSETMRTGHKVVLMDVASARVIRNMTIRELAEPHGIDFINDSVALVGALSGTSVAYVDVRHARVLRSVGGLPKNPYVIRLTRTGRAYVSSPHSSMVSEIDVATGRVTRTIHIPDDPAGIAVAADGKELYAAVWRDNGGGGIAIYDLERGVVAAKLPATQPRRMTITADGALLVVSDRAHLRIVDRATRQLRSVDLGANGGGSGVACAPDSTRCYVALSSAGEIVEVDLRAGRVLRRFAAQRGVDGVAYVNH
jgi:YVTN family beta-propeller protein